MNRHVDDEHCIFGRACRPDARLPFDARTQVNRCQTGYPKPRDERAQSERVCIRNTTSTSTSTSFQGPDRVLLPWRSSEGDGLWIMDYGPWTMAHIIGKSTGPQIRVLLQWYKGGLGGV